LEGAIAPIMRDNYIENISTWAIDSVQAGTVTAPNTGTTVAGIGTNFLTSFGAAATGGETRRVLMRIGDEYRQVVSVANDTTLTLDSPFLTDWATVGYAVSYGVGVIASSVSNLTSTGNRIDITDATYGNVPRVYYANSSGMSADVALTNATQGHLAIANCPNMLIDTTLCAAYVNTVQDAEFTSYADRIGDRTTVAGVVSDRQVSPVTELQSDKQLRSSMVMDYRNWFDQTGSPYTILSTRTPTMLAKYVTTSGSGGDLSVKVPASLQGKPIRIRIRAIAIGASSYIQFFTGATLGAATTALGAYTLTTAWNDYDFYTVTPLAEYFTVTKNTASVQWEFVSVEELLVGDVVAANLAGASFASVMITGPTTTSPRTNEGTGSPAGVVFGSPGDTYINLSGGAGTTLYVKETGVGTTAGWVGK